MIDWNEHRWTAGSPVRCTFKPRETYKGRALKPGLAELAGQEMLLQAMWQCEADENYPGEFALEGADDATKAMLRSVDIGWVASGDVVPANDQVQP